MKTIWKLEKCRQPHPLSDYIWDSNLRAVLVFNLYVQEWILASMCLPHRVLCLFHFVQDSPDQGVDAQHSLSTGKMRILFLSKMGLYEQLFWEDDHVSCSMQHLLSIWLLLWQEWCRRLSKAFQIHVLFFLFFFWVGTCFILADGILCLISVKNNGVMLCSPKLKVSLASLHREFLMLSLLN